MSVKTITVKQLEVPIDVIIQVSNVLAENLLEHSIKGGDEEKNIVFLEVHYTKDDRETIHYMEDLIEDYENEEEIENE